MDGKCCFTIADSKFRDLRMRGQFDEMLFCYCGFKVQRFADAWVERAGPELSALISTRRVAVNSFRFNCLLTPQVAGAFFALSTSYSSISY